MFSSWILQDLSCCVKAMLCYGVGSHRLVWDDMRPPGGYKWNDSYA